VLAEAVIVSRPTRLCYDRLSVKALKIKIKGRVFSK